MIKLIKKLKKKSKMRFYFASKFGNITKIRPNSEISNKASMVYKLNLLDYFRKKKTAVPNGYPHLYKGEIQEKDIEKVGNFSSLFCNKKEVNVMKVIGTEYNKLIDSTQKYSLVYLD
jgi:hypothetical protein